jgi:hypothetical protein
VGILLAKENVIYYSKVTNRKTLTLIVTWRVQKGAAPATYGIILQSRVSFAVLVAAQFLEQSQDTAVAVSVGRKDSEGRRER